MRSVRDFQHICSWVEDMYVCIFQGEFFFSFALTKEEGTVCWSLRRWVGFLYSCIALLLGDIIKMAMMIMMMMRTRNMGKPNILMPNQHGSTRKYSTAVVVLGMNRFFGTAAATAAIRIITSLSCSPLPILSLKNWRISGFGAHSYFKYNAYYMTQPVAVILNIFFFFFELLISFQA